MGIYGINPVRIPRANTHKNTHRQHPGQIPIKTRIGNTQDKYP